MLERWKERDLWFPFLIWITLYLLTCLTGQRKSLASIIPWGVLQFHARKMLSLISLQGYINYFWRKILKPNQIWKIVEKQCVKNNPQCHEWQRNIKFFFSFLTLKDQQKCQMFYFYFCKSRSWFFSIFRMILITTYLITSLIFRMRA